MKRLLPLLLLLILLSSCSIFKKKQMAALSITSNPKTGVFLDGEHIGSTPFYEEKIKPGEYSIRLVPENSAALPWETRVTLTGGILTVIARELGPTFDESSGHVLTLEPEIEKEKSSILVVTTPEGAIVNIDSEPKGFSPLSIETLDPGEHILTVSSPGYVEKSLKTQLEKGYKLTANVQLVRSTQLPQTENTKKENQKEEDNDDNKENEDKSEVKVLDKDLETEEKSEEDRALAGQDLKPPYVIIQETSTGWLNVRKEPTTASDIITKIYPKDQFKYLETSKTGWYQIQLDDKTEGWISSKYAKLIDD